MQDIYSKYRALDILLNKKEYPFSDNSIKIKELSKNVEYSVIEILWFNIAFKLKEFGMDDTSVKSAKESLFDSFADADVTSSINVLTIATIEVITYNIPVFFIVKSTGEILIYSEEQYINFLQNMGASDYITISLNALIKNHISVLYETPMFTSLVASKKERGVLQLLRKETYQSIKIIKKNGEIDMIESTERISSATRIVDILEKNKFQNIQIKQSNGNVALIERTIKTKL